VLAVPLAIHVAESQAEVDLLRDGSGPLAATAARTAFGFSPPGTTTVAYLDALGVLEATTAVHLCYATDADVALLGSKARGAVTCPRSNRYLSNPVPSAEKLLASGLPLGAGTDSSASNLDLDLMEEVRAIRAAEPAIPASALLEIATISGAKAIGVEERFGSLAAGRRADLALFAIDGGGDPVAAFVERAGARTLRAVMSDGAWRVTDGQLLRQDAAAAARANAARGASLEALASYGR
jgi:cytosine/adenosine deaminase-related metal-dependent hydrolase